MTYPSIPPGIASASLSREQCTLENAVIRCAWLLRDGHVESLQIENRETGKRLFIPGGLPKLRAGNGRMIDLAMLDPGTGLQTERNTISACFTDADSGIQLDWSARLDDDANAVIENLELKAASDITVEEMIFLDAELDDARQVGTVDGSVVVCGDIFLAIEHPLAKNVVTSPGHICCSLTLAGGVCGADSVVCSSVIGVTPPGQLRRGFLYYLENRRIHPYRPFLHYNNWYDVCLGRGSERITEAECLETIEYFGRELTEKRGVQLDAFVWDDGWDDFNTFWDFHQGFPDGFRNLKAAAGKYGAAQGVWLSPNGGYASAKEKRIAYGRPRGLETNENGFAMGGPNYRTAFRKACLRMIRDHGVVFFKFDGMGNVTGGTTSGTAGELSNDIHAILELARDLHREKPDLYVSATAGTWASPFWLLYADSIWRQGGDTGHHGPGNSRQQWITYRDMFCYERVVQAGPLYPLNSVMLHGIVIGNRPGRAPAGIALDETSVADEIWSFFASGTCLQELYVSPGVATETMLDQLASAVCWARANSETLIDTHWFGGNPGKGNVYGWASWTPGKGILALRNPGESAQKVDLKLKDALELPGHASGAMTVRAVYPRNREMPAGAGHGLRNIKLELAPFETLVMDLRCREM